MRQYQDHLGKSQGFRFVGVFPRDFAAIEGRSCVSEAMCRLNVASLRADGIGQIGIVFNLDDHTGRGSHWTSMYACIDPDARPHDRFGAFYYDSTGARPPPEMRAFMKRLGDEVGDPRFAVTHNTVRKQFGNTECGIYSMLFVVACLQTDIPFRSLCRDVMKRDSQMHGLRSVLFRPPIV